MSQRGQQETHARQKRALRDDPRRTRSYFTTLTRYAAGSLGLHGLKNRAARSGISVCAASEMEGDKCPLRFDRRMNFVASNQTLVGTKKAADLSATFVVRTSASHLAITDGIETPYNTKGRSMHPDRNRRRGSNNSRGHGRGRGPIFHRSPYQQLLRVRDRHANRLATPELVMVSPRQ
jgi:hypothetical protein